MTIDHRSAAEELDAAYQAIRQRWLELGTVWSDPVFARFAREHWAPLEAQTLTTGQALLDLTAVIAQAHRNLK